MPYRFRGNDAGVEAGMRRIAVEQIDRALASLDAAGEHRADAVHDVRKRCKKVRGLLRIVRPAFSHYKTENAAFRAIAKPLGSARDAKVMLDTYDAVAGDFEDALDRPAIAPVRAAMTRQRNAELARTDFDARFAQAREGLLSARERVAGWHLDEEGWGALAPGIGKTYRRACKMMHKSSRKPSGERHHEWRKRVKYHWYHTRLMRCLWPDHLKQRADEAHELANLLGDHHDCHVFEQVIRGDPETHGSPGTVETVIALTRRRAALLEEQAHRLGARLLADDTGALLERWGAWWTAWQREGDLHGAALER